MAAAPTLRSTTADRHDVYMESLSAHLRLKLLGDTVAGRVVLGAMNGDAGGQTHLAHAQHGVGVLERALRAHGLHVRVEA